MLKDLFSLYTYKDESNYFGCAYIQGSVFSQQQLFSYWEQSQQMQLTTINVYYATPDSSALACSINKLHTQTHTHKHTQCLCQSLHKTGISFRKKVMKFILKQALKSRPVSYTSTLFQSPSHKHRHTHTHARTHNTQAHSVTQHVSILSVVSALLTPISLLRSVPTVS